MPFLAEVLGRLPIVSEAAVRAAAGRAVAGRSGAGAWPWTQVELDPWETTDSPYYGAVLAALAVGTAPGGYAARPDIQH